MACPAPMDCIEIETELLIWRSPTSNSAGGYVRITGEAADAIRLAALTGQWADAGKKGGFGSARVMATIGETTWPNSVFPDKASGGWFLPVRKAVRIAEGIEPGDRVRLRIEL